MTYLRLAGAIIAFICISGFLDNPPLLPADAPGITAPEEYSFGDATHALDWHAASHILDQLEARFGKTIRIFGRNLDATTDPSTVKAYYGKVLGDLGWTEFPLSEPSGAWAFAFSKGGNVLAVEALPAHRAAGGIVPLNILTNLDDDGNPNTR